jgi:hypothetical protein
MIRALEDTNDIVFFDNKGVIMSAWVPDGQAVSSQNAT